MIPLRGEGFQTWLTDLNDGGAFVFDPEGRVEGGHITLELCGAGAGAASSAARVVHRIDRLGFGCEFVGPSTMPMPRAISRLIDAAAPITAR